MVPMSSGKCCSAIWISVVCGMIWIVWKDIIFWTKNFYWINFSKTVYFVENHLPQKIIGCFHPKFNFLLTPNIIFVLFESARRINCFLIRLFKLISIWWRPPPIKSANQGGAWIWKPSWLYSDASYIAAFLSCWYRHNTWSINIHQTIYLCLLAI